MTISIRRLSGSGYAGSALILLFDIYSVDQHVQLQRIRRQLAERERLFHLITENAADKSARADEERALRPYCKGKGYVSVEAQSDDTNGLGDMKTWVHKNCPRCGTTGHLVSDKEPSNS